MKKTEGRTIPSSVLGLFLLLAVCITVVWAGVTHYPNGIFVGRIGVSTPSVTPGENDLYVAGTCEIDGTMYTDGGMTAGGSIVSDTNNTDDLGSLSILWKNVFCMELDTRTIGYSDGDDAMTIADGGSVTFPQNITMTAAKSLTFPATAYATQFRIGTGSTAGAVAATQADGLFVEGAAEVDGAIRLDGVITSTADADFDATGGSTGDPDLSVDGYAKFAGSVELDGALDIDSSVNLDAATVVTEQVGSYHTLIRIGTGSTPGNASAIAADGLYVEGVAEIDGSCQIDGVVTATADVDLDATGGSTGDPDFSVDGYAKFAGSVELDGALDIDSSVNLDAATVVTETAGSYHTQLRIGTGSTPGNASAIAADGLYVEGVAEIDGAAVFDGAVSLNSTVTYATTKRLWFPASAFKLPSAQPAAASEVSSAPSIKFADSVQDDRAMLSIVWPDDCNEASDAAIFVVYVLDSDCTETEGEWNFRATLLSDGTVVSAAATDLTTIHDTPQDAQAVNVTASTPLGNALIADDSVTLLEVWHDIDDPFGDDAHLIGVYVEYTSDKP